MTNNNHYSSEEPFFEKPKVFGYQLTLENGEELRLAGSDILDHFLNLVAVRQAS